MTILITGGTGSLGSRIAKRFLDDTLVKHIVVLFSRDEQKQYRLRKKLEIEYPDQTIFIIGDVRDKNSLTQAVRHTKPDIIIHTAAQKHVRVCDENPEQAAMTNIYGTINVCEVAEENGVKQCCIVSTDKAVEPTTVYGMTKAIVEKIANNRAKALIRTGSRTEFVGVRYGNVLNSDGSLIPSYMDIAIKSEAQRKFPVTHKGMTRFFITFDQAINLIFHALSLDALYIGPTPNIYLRDGIFVVPTLPSAWIIDVATIFAEKYHGIITSFPIYPGEKFHESLALNYQSDQSLMSKTEVKAFLKQEGLI